MQERYRTILVHYIEAGGEPELELAYELGRSAIVEGIGVLEVVDVHYQALNDILQSARTAEDSRIIVQRAANLLKESLSPLEMTRRGYSETITALRSQNEKLVQLMEERARLLEQREDFMMVVTHDLKTPIVAANRCLNLMLEGDFGELTPEQTDVVTTMRDSNQQMFRMVKNMLEVYRYDQSTPVLCLGEVDVPSLIDAVAKTFQLSAQIRNVRLENLLIEPVDKVVADESAIQHVLSNLIDNALKFTPAGGSVRLTVQNVDGAVRFEVRDTGKGIGPEDLTKLFQRFFQSESGRKQFTGTGLGLYLCRKIIETHSGRIHCESQIGVGTAFIFHLPAGASRATDSLR